MTINNIFYKYMEGQLKDALSDVEMPESYYEKARTSYGSLKTHLVRSDSSIRGYNPEIFLQGSIRTGTAIKPITDDGSYDVDIVCNLQGLGKEDITQRDLKALVGNEIKSYSSIHSMRKPPHDGKRCWTIEYVDEANFHVDVLPTVDDSEARAFAISMRGFEVPPTARFMVHTDKRHLCYSSICSDWPSTNPIGYAEWFFEAADYESRRLRVAAEKAVSTDEVVPNQVKAPLQQYVQLLKRHRDIFFDLNRGLVSVRSIVITTLAVRAYEGMEPTGSWYEDFVSVVERLPAFIRQADDGGYYLQNPSDPLENFIQDWGEEEISSFRVWHKAVATEIAPSKGSLRTGMFNKNPRRELRKALGVPERGGQLDRRVSREAEYVAGLSHHQQHGMTEIDAIPVTVSATKMRSGGKPKSFQSGDELPKNVSLQFRAHAENIKRFRVRWQVTNDGQEALRAHCLRGGFYESMTLAGGRKTRRESTSYYGRHYVECILERDGVVYGRSEPFVVNIVSGTGANLYW